MNEANIFSQVGIGIATLIILLIVVKFFIENAKAKDVQITQMIEKFTTTIKLKDEQLAYIVQRFNNTINNHIALEMRQRKEQINTLKILTESVNQLMKIRK